jgi:hypothetical protein
MKLPIVVIVWLLLSFNGAAAACRNINPEYYYLKLNIHDAASVVIYKEKDSSEGFIGCYKPIDKKSGGQEFEFKTNYPVSVGFWNDLYKYLYVLSQSGTGTKLYQIFDTATGYMVANVLIGENNPTIIWPPLDDLPIICVNNKGINHYYDWERQETDGVYKFNNEKKKYIRVSRSTKMCSDS